MAEKLPHEWSSKAFLTKACSYAEEMLSKERDDWQFGFWSALCLEVLLRSTIANVSPVLLADAKDWKNIVWALDTNPATGKSTPAKSISTTEVISRLAVLVPKFTKEMKNFCTLHLQRRNAELHSGALAFCDLDQQDWLPKYYAACECLLSAQKSSIGDIFGDAEEEFAERLIKAANDKAAKSVNKLIHDAQAAWTENSPEDQKQLATQADILSQRSEGHRVKCPACESVGLLHGSSAGKSSIVFEDGQMVTRQPMLPDKFDCKACKLNIDGYSKLAACGLGSTFTKTSHVDPVDYFANDFLDRYSDWEEDNNEP